MRKIATIGERHGATPWMWVRMLLCAVLLVAAGTAQACHGHSAPSPGRPGHAMLVAPADDCPWCASAQVAMPPAEQATVDLLPRVEMAAVRAMGRATPVVWCATMWSRPPPVELGGRTRRLIDAVLSPAAGV